MNQEHVLVCLSPSPANPKIIEEAGKMAHAFGAEFTAIYIQETPEIGLSQEDESRLQANIRLAEDCGATITTIIGEDIPFQIAEFARISGVTKIVIGHSNTRQYRIWDKQSLAEKLADIVPGIAIYIIPDSNITIKPNHTKRFVQQIVPTWKDLILTVVLLTVVTVLGISFSRLGFGEANIITVFIFGVLVNAILTKSHFCSFLSSFCSVLLFNYFFTEPKWTLHAYEPEYYVTFVIMLIAALLTGSLAYRLKDNAKESAQAAYRTKVLFDTNRLLQKSRTVDDVMKVMANQIILLLNKDVVVYPVSDGILKKRYEFSRDGKHHASVHFDENEEKVVEWVYENKKRAGATTKVFPEARGLYLAIHLNGKIYGVVGIFIENEACNSFEYSILLSILGECALALENLKNEKDKEEAALIAQKEKLRANILRTISHDLRTPLTSISGNASNLLAHDQQLDEEMRTQIFSDILDDSEWLINLVENLLSVTRIEDGEMNLNTSIELVDDVIDEAMKHIDRNKVDHHICVKHSEDMLLAQMDGKLIVQVVINIVNNAIKYTQIGSEIVVESGVSEDWVYIKISDNGPGMNGYVKEHAFDMFYTGQNKVADSKRSMGLGLALCKSVMDAHGGKIEIEDHEPTGCEFILFLKKGDVSLYE